MSGYWCGSTSGPNSDWSLVLLQKVYRTSSMKWINFGRKKSHPHVISQATQNPIERNWLLDIPQRSRVFIIVKLYGWFFRAVIPLEKKRIGYGEVRVWDETTTITTSSRLRESSGGSILNQRSTVWSLRSTTGRQSISCTALDDSSNRQRRWMKPMNNDRCFPWSCWH